MAMSLTMGAFHLSLHHNEVGYFLWFISGHSRGNEQINVSSVLDKMKKGESIKYYDFFRYL